MLPKNPCAKFTATERHKLKEVKPELKSNISGMGKALSEAWQAVPEWEQEKRKKQYQEEMKIWKPEWDAYKETPGYRAFVEVKTD